MTNIRQEAEQALVGALLTTPNVFSEISQVFKEDFFETERAKKYYREIMRTIGEKEEIDMHILALGVGEGSSECMTYVEQCKHSCIFSGNIRKYADILRNFAIKDKLALVGHEMLQSIASNKDGLQIQKDALDQIKEVYTWANVTTGEVVLDSFIKYTFDLMEEKDLLDAGKTSLSYFVDALDEHLKGIQKGAYVIIGAEQGAGKTMVGLNIALKNANNGLRVKYYCTDMTRNELMQRIAGMALSIPINDFLPSRITQSTIDKITKIEEKLQNSTLFLSFDTGLTIEDIQQDIISASLSNPYDLVVVDYIQNVKSTNKKLNRWDVITKVTNTLRDLSKQYGTPIIGLAQINREGKKKMGTKPEVHHLEGGASIEQTATQIVLLYRDYEMDAHVKGQGLQMLIRKNRIGEARVDIDVNADYSKMLLFNSFL